MAGGKKGAKKTVGRARRVEGPRPVVKMFYVQRPNGSYSLRFQRVYEEIETEDVAEVAEEA
jgi:hypothetical protein